MGLLSTLIWLPIVGGLIILALGDRGAGSRPDRWFALVVSLVATLYPANSATKIAPAEALRY